MVSTGASFTPVRLTVTVALPVRLPESVTWTVRLNEGVVSKSSLVESATVMTPALLMAKAPELLPAVMENALVSPASTSFVSTVPTVTAFAVFSAILKVCGAMVGASLTSVRLIVTVLLAVRLPSSVTVTVRLKEGVVSKLSLVVSATVMTPAPLMANAPELFPPVIVKA